MKTIITLVLLVAATAARAHGHAEVAHFDGHEGELFSSAHHLFWFVVGTVVGVVGNKLAARKPQEVE